MIDLVFEKQLMYYKDMNIEKVSWNNGPDRVKFTMPLTKVNEELRQVSGFASLDNPDEHDDVVQADASSRAFSRFRGNIREMHQPIAVGKMVDFREDEYFDPKSNKTYKGIFVTVRVSKGAQDTWEKVLDGTLTGFSIGGHIIDAEASVVKSANGDKSIRIIKDYDLEELSLVDNPANQLANVFSIQKSKDGDVTGVSGLLVEKSTEIVYYCKEDEIAKTSTEDHYKCPQCQNNMTEAGWFEYSDDSDRVAKMAEVLAQFQKSLNEGGDSAEGGVEEMSDTLAKGVVNSDETSSDIPVGEQGKAQTEIDSSVEEVASDDAEETTDEVSEVEDEAGELTKMMDDLKRSLEDGLDKNLTEVNKKIEEVTKSFDEFGGKIEKRFKELDQKNTELSNKIAGIKSEVDSVEKSLRRLEAGTAIKKSGDLGGSSETVVRKDDDNPWRGKFLGADYLSN